MMLDNGSEDLCKRWSSFLLYSGEPGPAPVGARHNGEYSIVIVIKIIPNNVINIIIMNIIVMNIIIGVIRW